MLSINKYYLLRGRNIKGIDFSVNLDMSQQNATLSSSLKRAMIFKISSEVLSSVLICIIARSSLLTWLRSQITNTFHSLFLVLQNTWMLALCPLIFSFFLVQNLTLRASVSLGHLESLVRMLCLFIFSFVFL